MFQSVAKTSVSELKYSYKWTVENFSKIFNGVQVEAPSFGLDGYDWYLNLEKDDAVMSVYLIRSSSPRIFFKSQISISDDGGKCIHNHSCEILWNSTELTVLDKFGLEQIKESPSDEVIITLDMVIHTIVTKEIDTMPTELEHQADAKTWLCEDMLKMFDNQVQTDVVLNVNGEKINAHKAVLCARSPVFERMFQWNMAESLNNTVDITDVNTTAMKMLVDFMYSRIKYDCDFEITLSLYYAAEKYDVFKLREMCRQIILQHLTKDNVIQLLTLADSHHDSHLKVETIKFIFYNFKACVASACWVDFASGQSELYKEVMEFCEFLLKSSNFIRGYLLYNKMKIRLPDTKKTRQENHYTNTSKQGLSTTMMSHPLEAGCFISFLAI